MLELDEASDGTETAIQLGQQFAIRLSENPSTGFQWTLTAGGEPVCVLVRDEFHPASGLPGQPGSHEWQFRADQVGTGQIELVLRRAWETERAPARRVTIRPRVFR